MAKTVDRVGQLINDRYEIQGVLGRGGQGIVYRAYDRWMQRPVAVKSLSSKAAREPQTAERLIREQQALSSLKGTAAVEVFDICRGDQGQLCLVMELLKGTDLDEFLYVTEQRNERIELPRVAEIFDPIVDTLEVAHSAGILHRDLKPANVFLLEDGGVRLLDFGMARLKKAAPLTADGTALGSPSFMAPEAWRGRSELVDHRVDVYSLGVILFRVLAGDLPFAGQSLQEKFVGSTSAARPSLVAKRPDLPREVDDWVALALAIDREQRFRNVRALWNAFLSTLHLKSPKAVRSPSFWEAAKSAVKRIAGSGGAPRPEETPEREPSFGREELARSVMNFDPSGPPAAEGTIELTDSSLQTVAAPPRRPPPPPPRGKVVEATLELSSAELVAREETALHPAPEEQPRAPKPPPRRQREPSTPGRRNKPR